MIYLVRHTSIAAPQGLCYGRTEVLPDQNFLQQVQSIKQNLPAYAKAQIYSSPAIRCQMLARSLKTPYLIDKDLYELDFGLWEGLPYARINRAEIDVWAADFVNQAPPGGESFTTLQQRALKAARLWQAHHPEPVIVITHAGIIRALLCHKQGIGLDQAFSLPVDYASIHVY